MNTVPHAASDWSVLFLISLVLGFFTAIAFSLLIKGMWSTAFLVGSVAFQHMVLLQRYLSIFEEEPTPQRPTIGVRRF